MVSAKALVESAVALSQEERENMVEWCRADHSRRDGQRGDGRWR